MSRILVIEDDKVFAALITAYLQQHGHDAACASDGYDGLEQFKTGAFDVVVCDIVMPNREGIETIRELRVLKQDVAIVAISGGLSPISTSTVDVLDIAEMMGADASLKKPFPLPALVVSIDRALAARHAASQSVAS